MSKALTVSQFIAVINDVFDSLDEITVEGEVSEFKIKDNKWVLFSLKDKESSVGCFMTRWQLRTPIEDGMLVHAVGRPSLRKWGQFSFVVESVQPSGEGALKRAFELLKKKLEVEGLFARQRKRPIPRLPQHIGLITSRDAAAYTDFLKVLAARFGGLRISFLHTPVQGVEAVSQILEAIERANVELHDLDVLVLIRGGGSLEDLQAFNDEAVVRAVAASRTPIVVGVGHERDVTLAELAADVRASTPSNAAELIVPSRQELHTEIVHFVASFRTATVTALQGRREAIHHALAALRARVTYPMHQVIRLITMLSAVGRRFPVAVAQAHQAVNSAGRTLIQRAAVTIDARTQRLTDLRRILVSFSPDGVLRRGYSITRMADGNLVRDVRTVKVKSEITTQLHSGAIASLVSHIKPK